MLKRVSEALNKEVSYIKELHTRFFIFDDIQYLLKDEDNKEYLLVLSFDDNDRQKGYIWSKKVDRLMYYLYEYPLHKLHKVKNNRIKYKVVCEEVEKSDYRDEFSLNRFEIIYPNNKNYVLRYNNEALMLSIDNDKAIVGTWNNYTRRTTFLAMVHYIFKHFKNVKQVEYKNLLYNCQLDNKYWRHPDFYIPLPNSVEELKQRLSRKSRHNIKREKRIIVDDFGSIDLLDIKYEDANQELLDMYYSFKNKTHEVSADYDITKRNLTNIYVLKCGDDVKGIVLSCEQSEIAFIENHTFDSSLREYSFGQIMYDMYLEKMAEKGKVGLSLAGGDLEYKKRYGSICFNSYSGTIYRSINKSYILLWLCMYNVNNFFYRKIRNVIYKFIR